MAKPVLSGCVVMGIDLGQTLTSRGGLIHERTVQFLMNRMDAHQQLATWSTPDLQLSLLDRLRNRAVCHEIALSLPTCSQPIQSVRQQLNLAEQCNLRIQSCIVDTRSPAPLEYLARAGIRTLRPMRVKPTLHANAVQPQSLRFGLWGLPVSSFLPYSNRFGEHFAVRNLLVGLRLATLHQRAFHVVFDVPELHAAGTAGERSVDRILDYVGQLRATRGLQTIRLMDVDRSLQLSMAAQPTHSILRRVA